MAGDVWGVWGCVGGSGGVYMSVRVVGGVQMRCMSNFHVDWCAGRVMMYRTASVKLCLISRDRVTSHSAAYRTRASLAPCRSL